MKNLAYLLSAFWVTTVVGLATENTKQDLPNGLIKYGDTVQKPNEIIQSLLKDFDVKKSEAFYKVTSKLQFEELKNLNTEAGNLFGKEKKKLFSDFCQKVVGFQPQITNEHISMPKIFTGEDNDNKSMEKRLINVFSAIKDIQSVSNKIKNMDKEQKGKLNATYNNIINLPQNSQLKEYSDSNLYRIFYDANQKWSRENLISTFCEYSTNKYIMSDDKFPSEEELFKMGENEASKLVLSLYTNSVITRVLVQYLKDEEGESITVGDLLRAMGSHYPGMIQTPEQYQKERQEREKREQAALEKTQKVVTDHKGKIDTTKKIQVKKIDQSWMGSTKKKKKPKPPQKKQDEYDDLDQDDKSTSSTSDVSIPDAPELNGEVLETEQVTIPPVDPIVLPLEEISTSPVSLLKTPEKAKLTKKEKKKLKKKKREQEEKQEKEVEETEILKHSPQPSQPNSTKIYDWNSLLREQLGDVHLKLKTEEGKYKELYEQACFLYYEKEFLKAAMIELGKEKDLYAEMSSKFGETNRVLFEENLKLKEKIDGLEKKK